MKRIFGAAALLLVCLMLLVPVTLAFAEGSDTATTGSIDYSKFTPSYNITDGDGNATKSYSLGLGCGMGGITLFTDRDYMINFAYAANDSNAGEPPVPELELSASDPAALEKYLSVENGSVRVKAGSEPYSFNVAIKQNGEVTNMALNFNVAKYKLDFTDILLVAIGVYAIASAITGTGALFRNEFIKDGMEDKFKKTVRIAALIVGLCMIGVALLSIFGVRNDGLSWLKYVLFGIAMVTLIGSFVLTSRMTDKEKRAKAQATARTGGPTNSAAAFEFDENEPTIDDVLANINKNDPDNE